MKGSNQKAEGFDLEDLRKQVTRRRLIVGAVAGGWFFISNSSNEDYLTQAEDQFVELAGTLNDANLADPQQSGRHYHNVTNVIESVTGILERELPDDPETEQRVSALRAAREYYSQLASTLDTARSLRSQVEDSEHAVLNHDGELSYKPESAFDTDSFESSIVQLSEAEQDSEAVTSGEYKLVPNQQELVDSLRVQRDIFDQHLAAQQTYFDTASTIEAGIQAHEESQFETARSTLTQARESLTAGVPDRSNSYRVAYSGLSLDQYATLLNLRKEGVSKLLNVSDASVTQQRRRTITNEALNLFFESRRVVTN